jgi:hypothetical protein
MQDKEILFVYHYSKYVVTFYTDETFRYANWDVGTEASPYRITPDRKLLWKQSDYADWYDWNADFSGGNSDDMVRAIEAEIELRKILND